MTSQNRKVSRLSKIALATAATLALGGVWAQTASTEKADKALAAHHMKRQGGHEGHGSDMMGHMSGRMADRMLDRVKATPEQKAQIKKIMDKAHQDMKAQHGQHEQMRQQAFTLLAAPQLDEAAAEKLRQSMVAEHDQHTKAMLATMLEVGKVLTPEQRKQLADDFKKRGERHGMGYGKGHGDHSQHGQHGDHGAMTKGGKPQ